mmetsp:Transcript_18953/g.44312  ORF Transcript_18953/g.44312 Transcript_18953/m.44312 type:complete len:110 (+) Transcript_18953:156-485(+)
MECAKKVSLGNNYTEDEDVALCQAYVYGGKNASWKNNMSSNDFWEKKVLLKFIELCGNDPVAQTRKASHLKNNNRRKTTTKRYPSSRKRNQNAASCQTHTAWNFVLESN